MLEWIQRSQARRFLFRVLFLPLTMIPVHCVGDYYFDGRVKFSYLPHRIVVYLCVGILWGFLGWERTPSKKETPSAER